MPRSIWETRSSRLQNAHKKSGELQADENQERMADRAQRMREMLILKTAARASFEYATPWDRLARTALHLEVPTGIERDERDEMAKERDRQLLRAFQKYRLDPNDPLSWRILLQYHVFLTEGPPKKKVGRPKKPGK